MEPEPESKKLTAIEFVKAKLALNPEASFADIKAQAKVEALVIYPVVYGRAKALLGLVPTAPYGSKSKARKQEAEAAAALAAAPAAPAARAAPANGAGRTSRSRAAAAAEGDVLGSLEMMITQLKTAVQERDRYRITLEKIADLIRAELADG